MSEIKYKLKRTKINTSVCLQGKCKKNNSVKWKKRDIMGSEFVIINV